MYKCHLAQFNKAVIYISSMMKTIAAMKTIYAANGYIAEPWCRGSSRAEKN
jgi:hypothetical protein